MFYVNNCDYKNYVIFFVGILCDFLIVMEWLDLYEVYQIINKLEFELILQDYLFVI